MTIVKRTYRLFPGEYGIIDPLLSGARVLLVKREGIHYDVNNDYPSAPGGREFQHDSPNGTLRFLNPGEDAGGSGVGLPYDQTERVFCIFKY